MYHVTEMLSFYIGEHVPGNPQWGTPVAYLSEDERAAYELVIDGGLIYDAGGKKLDTEDGSSLFSGGRAIFVMDQNGKFYASKHHKMGRFHHSSLLAGGPVAAAGEIAVHEGKLVLVSDKSGHYQPRLGFTSQAFSEFEKRGVDISSVEFDQFGSA